MLGVCAQPFEDVPARIHGFRQKLDNCGSGVVLAVFGSKCISFVALGQTGDHDGQSSKALEMIRKPLNLQDLVLDVQWLTPTPTASHEVDLAVAYSNNFVELWCHGGSQPQVRVASQARQISAAAPCCPLRPRTTPFPEEKSILGVI